MKNIDYCVCCGSKNVKINSSKISPFVTDRMLGRAASVPHLWEECNHIYCNDCEYVGSSIRFDRDEEIRYYQNYMKEEYARHRSSYDGDHMYNFLMSYSGPQYQEMRQTAAREFLSSEIDFNSITSIVDYGGDTGAMIPNELSHAKRYVTDVQVRQLTNGVTAITDPSESGPVDLVICGHTLEHVSYPEELIIDIKRYIKPKGWIYIEVPLEPREYNKDHPGFHEHINSFNVECIAKLLEKNGIQPIAHGELMYSVYADVAIAILGQLK
jgi:SAM-dependent methyltransferase